MPFRFLYKKAKMLGKNRFFGRIIVHFFAFIPLQKNLNRSIIKGKHKNRHTIPFGRRKEEKSCPENT